MVIEINISLSSFFFSPSSNFRGAYLETAPGNNSWDEAMELLVWEGRERERGVCVCACMYKLLNHS